MFLGTTFRQTFSVVSDGSSVPVMGAKSGTRNRPQRLHVLGQTDQKLRDSIRRSSPFFISVPSLFGYILSILPPMGLRRFQKSEECSIHDPAPSVDKNHIQFGVWVISPFGKAVTLAALCFFPDSFCHDSSWKQSPDRISFPRHRGISGSSFFPGR